MGTFDRMALTGALCLSISLGCHQSAFACEDLHAAGIEDLRRHAQQVMRSIDSEHERHEVEVVGVWNEKQFQPGMQHCEMQSHDLGNGLHQVEFRFRPVARDASQGDAHVVSLRYRNQLLREVWVLKHDVASGNTLQCDVSIVRKWMEGGHVARTPWSDSCERLSAQETKHALSAGDVVYETDLRAPPSVRQNTPVSVTTSVGSVAIESSALALDDGYDGQQVRIKTGSGHIVLKGMVVAHEKVSIQ